MKKPISFLFYFLFLLPIFGQNASISGVITSGANPEEMVNVGIPSLGLGAYTDENGAFFIPNIPPGNYKVTVSKVGFKTITQPISIKNNKSLKLNLTLEQDLLNLDQVVISATRNPVPYYDSPVIVNNISSKTFENTQSFTAAEGLNFSPGLRVENNCQNCGFTQVRMNGMEGHHSQVLINNRPVFSALAGIYGLEMIPANMIDRVEVVKGGGSVLYGGNAIAGTINIITTKPFENEMQVGVNQALVNGEASDRNISLSGSVVNKQLTSGMRFYAFNRTRDPWDANADGFSEMVKMRSNTIGFDGFYEFSSRSVLKLNGYYINEFRRGGNKFNLQPHQTDVTEQLLHNIFGANLNYEYFSKNYLHKLNVYSSFQTTQRDSYYGGGGRVLQDGDTLTADDLLALNAYGESNDISLVSGVQYTYLISEIVNVVAGSEYQLNDVIDAMLGYEREINQFVGVWGNFAQLELDPIDKLCITLGGRYDQNSINGNYNLGGQTFNNQKNFGQFVPRITALYEIKENLKFRVGAAQGYRGPQAFDEDLHIETVGGAAKFIQIDPSLQAETSNNFTASLNYAKRSGKAQMNLVAEGFYTKINNPFILSNQQELANGVAVITKRNGAGITLRGVNLEGNLAINNQWLIQTGFTIQQTAYGEPEILWEPSSPNEINPATIVTQQLRTPNLYGFLSVGCTPNDNLNLNFSGNYTGTMLVPHVINVDNEYTVVKETPDFLEINAKASYTFFTDQRLPVEVFAGIQNITNSFQADFDLGADRDAGYIYGPLRPRTFFAGLKVSIK